MRIPSTISESSLRRIEALRALRAEKSAASKQKSQRDLQATLGALPIVGQGAAALSGYSQKPTLTQPPRPAPSLQPPMSRGEQSQALDARNWTPPPSGAPAGVGAPAPQSPLAQSLDARQWRPPAKTQSPPSPGGPSLSQRYQAASPYLQNNPDALILRLLLGV